MEKRIPITVRYTDGRGHVFRTETYGPCRTDVGIMQICDMIKRRNNGLSRMTFVDEDGDKVILDNHDSLVEAVKAARKNMELVIWLDGPKPFRQDPVPVTPGKDSYVKWFTDEKEKMKTELKREILEEMKQSGLVASTGKCGGRGTCKRGKRDYISRCLMDGALLGHGSSNPAPTAKEQPTTAGGKTAVVGGMGTAEIKSPIVDRPAKLDGPTPKERKYNISEFLPGQGGEEFIPSTNLHNISEFIAGQGGGEFIPSTNLHNISEFLPGQGGEEFIAMTPLLKFPSTNGLSSILKSFAVSTNGSKAKAGNCGDYIKRAVEEQWKPVVASVTKPFNPCTICARPVSGQLFVCLDKKCQVVMCRGCEPRHCPDHSVIRIQEHLYHGDHGQLLGNIRSSCGVKKEKKTKTTTAPTTKWSAECLKTKTEVEGNNVVVTWLVANTGMKQWDEKVKLVCDASSAGLTPAQGSIPIQHIKQNEKALVNVHLVATGPGEYITIWNLYRRGKSLGTFTAVVMVKSPQENEEDVPISACVLKQSEKMKETPVAVPVTSDKQPVEKDEEHSEASDFTECKSALEDEYDVICGNEDITDEEDSYMCIAPSALNEQSKETVVPIVPPEAVIITETTCSDKDNSVDATDEAKCGSEVDPIKERDDNSEKTTTVGGQYAANVEPGVVAEQGPEPAVPPTMNSENTSMERSYSSDETASAHSSRVTEKSQQRSVSVASAISNALLTTTQTLATVGATAKDIHTAAAAIVRNNFRPNEQSTGCHAARAWVPKATQTTWTQEETEPITPSQADLSFDDKLMRLAEMGFTDTETNRRLLVQLSGDVDIAVLALLNE